MTQKNIKCSVYRSDKREELYLLVESGTDLNKLNETMLVMFGTPEFSFEFDLNKQKKLARLDSVTVLEEITKNGYYLQLPPNDNDASNESNPMIPYI